MKELALHLLDIAENSISAGSANIRIEVEEHTTADRLRIRIEDDGCGMGAETVARISDPFVTSRTTRKVGLGIPLLKAAAEACEGYFTIESAPGKGTRIEVTFRRSHIDRMPLGDLAGTIHTLVIGSPEIHWAFVYRLDGREFVFDDEPIKQELEGIPLSTPPVLKYIRQTLQEGIASLQAVAQGDKG